MSGLPCEKDCARCRMAGSADPGECARCKAEIPRGRTICDDCACVICRMVGRAEGRRVCWQCMYVRDEMARSALVGLLSSRHMMISDDPVRAAVLAYGFADEMIRARSLTGPSTPSSMTPSSGTTPAAIVLASIRLEATSIIPTPDDRGSSEGWNVYAGDALIGRVDAAGRDRLLRAARPWGRP